MFICHEIYFIFLLQNMTWTSLARFHKIHICRWCVMFLLSHFFNETIALCTRHGQCVIFNSIWVSFKELWEIICPLFFSFLFKYSILPCTTEFGWWCAIIWLILPFISRPCLNIQFILTDRRLHWRFKYVHRVLYMPLYRSLK